MQQVLKSRAFLQQYARTQAVRAAMDCGECDAPNLIQPKTWGLCEYRAKRELLTLKFMCWIALPACALAALYLNWSSV